MPVRTQLRPLQEEAFEDQDRIPRRMHKSTGERRIQAVVEGLQAAGGRRRSAQRIEQLAAQARIIVGILVEATRRGLP